MSRNRKAASASPNQPLIDTAEDLARGAADIVAGGRHAVVETLLAIADIRE